MLRVSPSRPWKTWFSIGLVFAVAGEGLFGPWQVHQNPPLLYIEGEMLLEIIHKRIQGLRASEALMVLNRWTLFHKAREGFLNLSNREGKEAIRHMRLANAIKVLVLDNLFCLFSGVHENEVKGPLRSWRTEFLFDYEIFPKTILRFDAEWLVEDRGMAVGNVIVQRAVFPPIGFGLCIEFAVRICRVIDEELRLGFAYETLYGHVEKGVAEFYFEEREESVDFTIHTYSEPGHWTSRLLKNIFSERYQAWCTQRALTHVRRRFQSEGFRVPQGKNPL